jgi:RhtB (resistance to homoserine/threonine) family protein
MLGIHDYWLFICTGIVLNLTPGQDTMFIIGRSLTGGRSAGFAAVFGVCVGSICHTLAAALGFSALIATSAVAFTTIKLVGAVYLIYLGAKMLLSRPEVPLPQADVISATDRSTQVWSSFRQGIVTNILNPKVALFFLALLPQFIDLHSHNKAVAFIALGATFIATGLLWSLVLALGASRLRSFFARYPSVRAMIDRAVGALFIGLGVRLVWSR